MAAAVAALEVLIRAAPVADSVDSVAAIRVVAALPAAGSAHAPQGEPSTCRMSSIVAGNLDQLVERLRKALGDDVLSVILYGSAATGDPHDKFSDLNVLCVLKQITPVQLRASETVFHWWRQQGNPAPLLLTDHEVQTSTDCFAIEFRDIKQHIGCYMASILCPILRLTTRSTGGR